MPKLTKKEKERRKKENRKEQKKEWRRKHDEQSQPQREEVAMKRNEVKEKNRSAQLRTNWNKSNVKKRKKRNEALNDNRPTFEMDWDDFPEEPDFSDFRTNPETAVMLYRSNQGFPRFRYMDRVDDTNSEVAEKAIRETCKSILKEELTAEQQEDLIDRFHHLTGRSEEGDSKLLTCACCGIKAVQRNDAGYKYLREAEYISVLQLNEGERSEYEYVKSLAPLEIPVDNLGTTNEVFLHRAMNVYEYKEQRMWLYEDFVEKEDNGTLSFWVCSTCSRSLEKDPPERPPYCLAKVNMGDIDRLGLETPTLMERMILADVRHHFCVKKITANYKVRSDHRHSKICAHGILFAHGMTDVSMSLFDAIDRAEKAVACHFIGPRNSIDGLMHQTLGTSIVSGHWYVIYQHTLVSNALNSHKKKRELPDINELRDRLNLMTTRILQNAMVTEDETLNAREQAIGDDVARVRKNNDQVNFDGAPNLENLRDTESKSREWMHPEGFSFATDRKAKEPTRSTQAEADAKKMQDFADLMDMGVPKAHVIPECEREGTPMNEFENGDKCLTMAFPDIFLFGKAYDRSSGSLTQKQRLHLLGHYKKYASTNRDLLAFLFDQFIRHDKIQRISHYAKGNPKKLKELDDMKNCPDFHKRLRSAIKNPTSKDAKDIRKRIDGALSAANRNTYIGAMERTDSIPKMRACSRYYGAGYNFFTFAPVDVNNPTTLRMTMRSGDNRSFPAVDDDTFIQKLKEQSTVIDESEIELPFSYNQRMIDIVQDPVSSVAEYQCLVSALIMVMFGITPNFHGSSGFKNHSTFYGNMKMGAFGTCTGLIGVHETQARGSLHLHCIMFGGLPPELLKRCSHIPEISEAIRKVLDSQFSASVPRKVHAKYLVEQQMKKDQHWRARVLNQSVPPMFSTSPSPVTKPKAFFERVYTNCRCYQYHVHSFTCHKGNTGTHYCRLNFGRDLCHCTCCVELADEYNELNVPIVKVGISKPTNTHIHPKCQVEVPSKRLLVWELKRPSVLPISSTLQDLLDVPTFSSDPTDDEFDKENIIEAIKVTLEDEFTPLIEAYLGTQTDESIVQLAISLENDLPTLNGKIVEHSPVISSVTCCNQAAMHLGDEDQSYASMFYLSDYFGKNKVQMEHCLSSLERAIEHTKKYPSIASDSGSSKRNGQHVLTALVNKLDGGAEFADVQMVAAMNGNKAEVATDKFGYFGPHEALRYALNRLKRALYTESSDLDSDESDRKSEDDDGSVSTNVSETVEFFDEEGYSDEACSGIDDDENDNDARSTGSLGKTKREEQEGENEEKNDYAEFCIDQQECSAFEDIDEDLGRHLFWSIKSDVEAVDPFGDKILMKDKKSSVLVNVNDHWQYRGKELRYLTREEYNAIVDIKPITKANREKFEETGKPIAGCFVFETGHPLAKTHWQQLRTRHQVLIFTGKEPSFPGPFPNKESEVACWKRKADAFAKYYLISYRMEPDNYNGQNQSNYEYNFEVFCDYLDQLKQCPSTRSKVLWLALQRSIFSFRTSTNKKERLNRYRGRKRTKWTDEEKNNYRQWYDQQQVLLQSRSTELSFFEQERQNIKDFENSEYLELQSESIGSVFGPFFYNDDENHARKMKKASSKYSDLGHSKSMIDKYHDALRDGAPIGKKQASESSEYAVRRTKYKSLDEYCEKQGISLEGEQQMIIDTAAEHFTKITDFRKDFKNKDMIFTSSEAPNLLVLGGPGAGKTTTLNCLPIVAEIEDVGDILRFSYMGITSIHIGGETFSSVFYPSKCNASTIFNMGDSQLSKFMLKYDWSRVAAIMVDEISTFSPNYLAIIDHRLREATKTDLPFGGLMMILCGDWVQMKPVQVSNFISSMMSVADGRAKKGNSKFATGTVARRGVDLMMKFGCLMLEKQQRAKGDVKHADMIHRLHDGNQLSFSDLKRMKRLTAEDAKDPAWKYAPIIVLTNRERFDICWSQARRYAKEHGLPIIRWKRKLVWWKNRPKNWSSVEESDPLFWQFIILGVDCFVLKNLSPQQTSIANGTPCRPYSISFDTPKENRDFKLKYERASGGDILTLEVPPLSINIIPWPEDKEKREHCKPYSMMQRKIVVPLLSRGFSAGTKDKGGYFVPAKDDESASTALTVDVLPIDMAFAMTVNKALGRTLRKVILALEQRPNVHMCFHKLFVALSRVQCNDDMRFLTHNEKQCYVALSYLTKVKPTDELIQFLHGFSGEPGSPWNPKLSMMKKRQMMNVSKETKKQNKTQPGKFIPLKKRKQSTIIQQTFAKKASTMGKTTTKQTVQDPPSTVNDSIQQLGKTAKDSHVSESSGETRWDVPGPDTTNEDWGRSILCAKDSNSLQIQGRLLTSITTGAFHNLVCNRFYQDDIGCTESDFVPDLQLKIEENGRHGWNEYLTELYDRKCGSCELDWKTKKVIILQVFWGHREHGHYASLILDRTRPHQHVAVYADSLPSFNSNAIITLKTLLSVSSIGIDMGTEKMSWIEAIIPQQEDATNDCGVYASCFALLYIRQLKTTGMLKKGTIGTENRIIQDVRLAFPEGMTAKKFGRVGRSYMSKCLENATIIEHHELFEATVDWT